jgi:hypothetical protein
MLSLQVSPGREAESKDLRVNMSEQKANRNDLHTKLELALACLEEERDRRAVELESLQEDENGCLTGGPFRRS